MNILVDTQLVVAFYKESIGVAPQNINCSGPVIDLFSKIVIQQDVIFVDHAGVDGQGKELDGQIVTEWRKYVPKDWFETWYATLLLSGQIKYIPIGNSCHALLQTLQRKHNFPLAGGDKWYIRTAKSVQDHSGAGTMVVIVTEDLDFYDPNQKNVLNGQARIDFIKLTSGPIPPLLAIEGIIIKCTCVY